MYVFVAAALSAAQPAVQPAVPAIAPAPANVVVAAGPPSACCVLAKLTPVYLTVDEALDSDKVKIGQSFALSLSWPLQIAPGVVVPAGTKGMGEVVHAAKSRAMGKPGELLLAARFLDWNGTRIPLRSFKFGKGQGKDNADTAAIVGFAVSALAAPFITGGEVRIPAGTDAWAKVATDVGLPAPAPAAETVQAPTTGGAANK